MQVKPVIQIVQLISYANMLIALDSVGRIWQVAVTSGDFYLLSEGLPRHA